MSLITCCPTCQTMFQVSGDDLRVSDGWVRCGNCNSVFDASAHLQGMPVVTQAPELAATVNSVQFSLPSSAPLPPTSVLPEPSPSPSPPSSSSVEGPSLVRAATSGERQLQEPVFAAGNSSQAGRWSESVQQPDSFPSSPVPQRSSRRALWVLVWAFLGILLLAGVRHERQALVQHTPALLPLLDALCKVTNCEVQAPRLLDRIAIEDAAVQELEPSAFKVQLLVRNSGDVALTLPSLEITLTGLQGEVLARHTALASDFAPGVSRLFSGEPLKVDFRFSAELASLPVDSVPAVVQGQAVGVAASLDAPTDQSAEVQPTPLSVPSISGYRIVALYP